MTPKERAAMQLALEALKNNNKRLLTGLKISNKHGKLEFEPVYSEPVNRPQNCGTGYCSCIECPYEAEQAEQKPLCNQHPDAPHGFARNASHNAGRYVCECEGWEPPKAEQEPVCCDKCGAKLGTTVVLCDCIAPMQQAEQKPMAIDWEPMQNFWRNNSSIDWGELESAVKCAVTAPVRTKDLTDDEIWKANKTELPDGQDLVDFARAVIAADREKNK